MTNVLNYGKPPENMPGCCLQPLLIKKNYMLTGLPKISINERAEKLKKSPGTI